MSRFPAAFLFLAAALASTSRVHAQDIDLATGTAGTFTGVPQSFNETRGLDVTVAAADFHVASMTLRGLSVAVPTAIVGARIYDHATMALLASAQTSVTAGVNQTVTVPLSQTLAGGSRYRVCFFLSAGGSGASGTMFDPAPSGVGGFPYTEATGRLVVNQAYSTIADTFPASANFFVPLITLGAAIKPFCFGDDSGTDCPCSTAGGGSVAPGLAGNGCPNSNFAGGAHLGSAGAPRLSGDTLVLQGSAMPNSSALYYQGSAAVGSGPTYGSVFGDGLRCVGTSVVRLKTVTNAAGSSSYPQPGDLAVSVRGGVATPGTRYYQVWYRNSAAFCTSSTFNLSNGLSVIWGA